VYTPQADAEAIATFDFTSNFNGSLGGISFSGVRPLEHGWPTDPLVSWTITDLTTGTLILNGFPEDPSFPTATFQYDDWDSTHTYQLRMLVNDGTNNVPNSGWLATNIFSVDEPATLGLLLVALSVGGACFRRTHVRTTDSV
jgi:hypothetical protein